MIKKYFPIVVLCIMSISLAQHGHGGHGNQMPKGCEIFGTVVDSLTGVAIEYASISVIGPDKNIETGGTNTMVGRNAGQTATTASGSVFLGVDAGGTLTTGNDNIAICLRGVVGMPNYRHVFPSIRWAPDLMMIPALLEINTASDEFKYSSSPSVSMG